MKKVSSAQLGNITQLVIAYACALSYAYPEDWGIVPVKWIILAMCFCILIAVIYARSSRWDGSVSQIMFTILEVIAYISLILMVYYSPTLPKWAQDSGGWFFVIAVLLANGGQLFQWLATKTVSSGVPRGAVMMQRDEE